MIIYHAGGIAKRDVNIAVEITGRPTIRVVSQL